MSPGASPKIVELTATREDHQIHIFQECEALEDVTHLGSDEIGPGTRQQEPGDLDGYRGEAFPNFASDAGVTGWLSAIRRSCSDVRRQGYRVFSP